MRFFKQMTVLAATMCASMCVTIGVAVAESQAGGAELLGTELTPLGSDPAASADGTIPAWTGGLTKPPAGYVKGGDHIDPYADDQRLFTITAKNADQYKDKLSQGQLALLARSPETFRMDVYPTRRSCALPQHVYDATKQNASTARLVNDGNGIEGARIGVPFPVPKTAVEIYWNHNFHWQGHGYHAKTSGANVYADGTITSIVREDWRYNYYADPQFVGQDLDNRQFVWMGIWSAPVRFNGSGFSMINTIDQVERPREGFMFRPDLRKIIRATPAVATYDGPLSTSEGLRQNDNMFLFSGAPDRYDWRIVGKREIYVPYNAYKATMTTVADEDLMTPTHLNPDYLRYELHRVWEVEAKLKDGSRSNYGRRMFYVDEDSWIFLLGDLYNNDDELVRVQHSFIKNYYEAPACVLEFDVMYDLALGRYNVDHLKNKFGPAQLDYETDPGDFGSSALKRKVGR
jgi:hypothetical protein